MLPFAAVSSSQILLCVCVSVNAVQPYWGPVIKVNNPSLFLNKHIPKEQMGISTSSGSYH